MNNKIINIIIVYNNKVLSKVWTEICSFCDTDNTKIIVEEKIKFGFFRHFFQVQHNEMFMAYTRWYCFSFIKTFKRVHLKSTKALSGDQIFGICIFRECRSKHWRWAFIDIVSLKPKSVTFLWGTQLSFARHLFPEKSSEVLEFGSPKSERSERAPFSQSIQTKKIRKTFNKKLTLIFLFKTNPQLVSEVCLIVDRNYVDVLRYIRRENTFRVYIALGICRMSCGRAHAYRAGSQWRIRPKIKAPLICFLPLGSRP